MKKATKQIYRISLNSGATKLIEELALTAAKSNGGEAPITFPFISMIAESIKKLDDEKESITVEIQEADKWICIDMKSPQWVGYKTVLKIEQVEISELVDEEVERLQSVANISQQGAGC